MASGRGTPSDAPPARRRSGSRRPRASAPLVPRRDEVAREIEDGSGRQSETTNVTADRHLVAVDVDAPHLAPCARGRSAIGEPRVAAVRRTRSRRKSTSSSSPPASGSRRASTRRARRAKRERGRLVGEVACERAGVVTTSRNGCSRGSSARGRRCRRGTGGSRRRAPSRAAPRSRRAARLRRAEGRVGRGVRARELRVEMSTTRRTAGNSRSISRAKSCVSAGIEARMGARTWRSGRARSGAGTSATARARRARAPTPATRRTGT